MPVKRLPKELVERLRKASARLRLGKMKNIDHRLKLPQHGRPYRRKFNPEDISMYPGRVREINVSRNYPDIKVVLKVIHDDFAQNVVKQIKEIVAKHNRMFLPEKYVLRMPYAYVINNDIIAMSKANFPSVKEIFRDKTPRARRMINSIRREILDIENRNLSYREAEEELSKVWRQLSQNLGSLPNGAIADSNMLLLGYKNGKYVFIPLMDSY